MPLHLIKLCVGVDSLDDLRRRFDQRLARYRAEGVAEELSHTTRMVPKRRDELANGSLYWVIRGRIQARQRLLDIRPFVDGEGIGRCRLVLDSLVVATEWQPRRPFQGWRYFDPKDVPRDIHATTEADFPVRLRGELAELGLL